MKRVKTIDELYEEVREFDLVITTDAALATALNGRIDKPIVGSFAMTPKQIASHIAPRVMDVPLMSELKVIASVSKETGFSLKYVHSEIENINEIRQYTKEVKQHLHSEASKAIYDSYEPLPTLYRLMGAFIPDDDEFYMGNKVAVIGEEFFNDLDKHFIPIDHSAISIFTKDSFDIDTIYEIGNDRQLAENAVDLLDPQNPFDYAIVLNTSSPIADAVRASLYRKSIPFINALNVRDLSQIRDYLQFISLAMDFETVRVKHVKELYSNYNGFFKKGREEFLLCKQTDEYMSGRSSELWRVMRDIGQMTYSEVCDAICDKRARIQVSILIDELDVKDRKITPTNLAEVRYAVDKVKELTHNEEIPDNEKKGILLVDCNNSVYIDRPVVIYLGMEQDWNKSVVGKKYLDVEEETDKNVMKLGALIQQGSVRYYLVNSTKGGKTARPSMLFDLLYKRPVDSFECMCGSMIRGRWHAQESASIPKDEDRGAPSYETFHQKFSKSSLDNYYVCPRKFMYGIFLKTPEEKSTEFGILIHAFAEFYVCYPEDVRALGLDNFIGMVSDRFSGLSSPLMEPLDNAKIKQAMRTMVEYIDHLGIKDPPLDRKVCDCKEPNLFMVAMGKEYTSSICEQKLESKRYPVYGILDLLWDGAITDYKTGKPTSPSDLVEAMTFGSKARFPEFQAPIYLTLVEELMGKTGDFNLFYAMDNDVSSQNEQTSILSNVVTVSISEKSLKETMVTSRRFREYLRGALNSTLCDYTDEIMDLVGEIGGEDPGEWKQDSSLIGAIITDVLGKNDNPSNRKTVTGGLSKITDPAKFGMLAYQNIVEIPRVKLEQIMSVIEDMHDQMMAQSKTEFPPVPLKKCKECTYFSVCTKEPIQLEVNTDE